MTSTYVDKQMKKKFLLESLDDTLSIIILETTTTATVANDLWICITTLYIIYIVAIKSFRRISPPPLSHTPLPLKT